MLPLQTTVDSVLDGLYVFGKELIGRYWWAGVVVLLAFYLRMFGAAYADEDVDAPTARAFPLLAKKLAGYGKEAVAIVAFFGAVVVSSVVWGFDIATVILTGLPTGDPFIWGSVVAGASAAFSGVHDLVIEGFLFAGVENYDGFWASDFLDIGLVQVAIVGAGTYILFTLAEMVFGWRDLPEEDRGFDPDERGYGSLPGLSGSNDVDSPVDRIFGDDDD